MRRRRNRHEESRHDNEPSPRRLYRDKEHAIFFGVCAGIADHLGIGRCMVRFITVITGLFWFPVIPIIYLALGFMLPARPEQLFADPKEEKFWRSMRQSPSETFSDVRYRFRQLDQRMQRLERYVTSRRFRLDREFRDLENGRGANR